MILPNYSAPKAFGRASCTRIQKTPLHSNSLQLTGVEDSLRQTSFITKSPFFKFVVASFVQEVVWRTSWWIQNNLGLLAKNKRGLRFWQAFKLTGLLSNPRILGFKGSYLPSNSNFLLPFILPFESWPFNSVWTFYGITFFRLSLKVWSPSTPTFLE